MRNFCKRGIRFRVAFCGDKPELLTVENGKARWDMENSMNKVNYGLARIATESFQLKS
jgi:hypothetical protein